MSTYKEAIVLELDDSEERSTQWATHIKSTAGSGSLQRDLRNLHELKQGSRFQGQTCCNHYQAQI